MIIVLGTNNFGGQNSYTLKDLSGNVIVERSGLANNTFYRDTVFLDDGCYVLELEDTGGNGLEFWAQPSQGAGFFALRTPATTLKTFDPHFGNGVKLIPHNRCTHHILF